MLPQRLLLRVGLLRSCGGACSMASCSRSSNPTPSAFLSKGSPAALRLSQCFHTGKELLILGGSGHYTTTCTTSDEERGTTLGKVSSDSSMLETIVNELNLRGSSFLLPYNDERAMESLSGSLERLTDAGIRPEFVIDACVKSPELFCAFVKRGTSCFELVQLLVDDCEFTYEDALRLISSYTDELMTMDVAAVQKRVLALADCGIAPGKMLGSVVRKLPSVLFLSDAKKMKFVIEGLAGFFSRGQLTSIISTSPHIILADFDQLELKYEYLYFNMGIQAEEFCDCSLWVDMPLEDIMARHKFLEKTGRYTMPNLKRPQIKMENPKLKDMLDSEDEWFATVVSGVTLEEWLIFKELCIRQSEIEDLERPYEKLKPSTRKAFERKWKAKAPKDSYKFETEEQSC